MAPWSDTRPTRSSDSDCRAGAAVFHRDYQVGTEEGVFVGVTEREDMTYFLTGAVQTRLGWLNPEAKQGAKTRAVECVEFRVLRLHFYCQWCTLSLTSRSEARPDRCLVALLQVLPYSFVSGELHAQTAQLSAMQFSFSPSTAEQTAASLPSLLTLPFPRRPNLSPLQVPSRRPDRVSRCTRRV